MAQDREAFLSRWSRRKRESDHAPKEAPREDKAQPKPPAPGEQARAGEKSAAAAAPTLPSLEQLTKDSDYAEFMKPGVDPSLRRAALKKLFMDPRFNVIDPLDIDIEDLSNLEKLAPEMVKTLAHAKRTLLGWGDEEKKDEPGAPARDETPPQVADASDTQSAPAAEPPASRDEARPESDPSNKKA